MAGKKADSKVVAAKVDRMGDISEQLKMLKKEDEALREELKADFAVGTTLYGERHEVLIGESARREVSPEGARKLLKPQQFLSSVKVSMTEIKKYLSLEQIDGISSVEMVKTITVVK